MDSYQYQSDFLYPQTPYFGIHAERTLDRPPLKKSKPVRTRHRSSAAATQLKKVKVLANIWEQENQRQSDLELFQLVAKQEQSSREFWIKVIIFLLPSVFSAGIGIYMAQLDQWSSLNQAQINQKTIEQLSDQMNEFVNQTNQWVLIGPLLGILLKMIFFIAFVLINLLVELGVSSIKYFKGILLLTITLSGPVISLIFFILLHLFSRAKLITPFMTIETYHR